MSQRDVKGTRKAEDDETIRECVSQWGEVCEVKVREAILGMERDQRSLLEGCKG